MTILRALGPRLDRVRSRWEPAYSRVWWVGEGVEWVIDWYARELARRLQRLGLSCHLAPSCRGVRRQLVHFASRNAYFSGPSALHVSNRAVMTWFHGSQSDPDPENQRMIRLLPEHAGRFSRVVTACSITRERLVGWGVPEERVVIVPLGVDLSLFRPVEQPLRRQIRHQLGIPQDAICIGSFQKDGLGWGEGMQPKPIKGPDVLLAVVERLARRQRIFVLLTGPARGYVKQGLDRLNIPYHHAYLDGMEQVARYYHALDLYLVSARDEGGPMSVLESLASGVPLVSTKVGMATDVIRDGENGCLVEVEDVDGLAAAASRLIDDEPMRRRCVERGLQTAQGYDWSAIAQQYHERVYRPLMEQG